VGNIPVSDTTCLLPPRSRVLLEKLTGSQLVKEILRILRNSKIHYRVYKSPTPVLNLSQIIQSMSVIRLPEDASQYYPPISGWFFQAVSSPQISSLTSPILSPICSICPTHLILLDFFIRITFGEEYRSVSGPGSGVAIATGYGLDGPGIESQWDEILRICPGRLWGPPSLLYNGYRVFPGGKKRLGRDADPSPFLVP